MQVLLIMWGHYIPKCIREYEIIMNTTEIGTRFPD